MILLLLLLQTPTLDALHSKDVDTRRAAAIRVMDGDAATRKQALPSLIEILSKEKDGQVRLAAFEAITRLGPDAAPAVPSLIETLLTDYGGQQKEEIHQDYRAALALGAIGKPAVEELRKLLDFRKENVRAESIMALGKVGPDAAPAVPDLIPKLDDSSARLRREAATALGRIGSPAVEALIKAASSEKVNMRSGAIEALGQSSSPTLELTAAVLKASADRETPVRQAAFRSLARLTLDPDLLAEPLKSGLNDCDAGVRLAASDALRSRRPLLVKSSLWLAEQLRSRDDGVARSAADLLGAAGPDAAPLLLAALTDPSTRIDPIAQALAHHGRRIVPELGKASKSPDPRVRRAVAIAIGSVRPLPAEALPALGAALGDPDAEVRTAALGSLAALGQRAKPAAESVANLLKDPSPEVRRKAIEVLAVARPRDPAMLGQITPLLDDPDPAVQRTVIATVRSAGPLGAKALPAIAAKLEKGPDEVRIAAAEFVGSQGAASAGAVPQLLTLLDEQSLSLRLAAANALGKIGAPAQSAAPKLAALLDAESPEARETSIVALGNLELDADAMHPHVSRSLRDANPKVWGAGLRSIQRLGPQGVLLLPDIIALTARPGARQTAQRALRRFERQAPDPKVIPSLIPLLDHESDSVRLLAIKFLALAGPGASPAIPALERLRDHKNPEVREQAEAACRQIRK